MRSLKIYQEDTIHTVHGGRSQQSVHLFENVDGVFERESSLSLLFLELSSFRLLVSYFPLKFAQLRLIFNLHTTTIR